MKEGPCECQPLFKCSKLAKLKFIAYENPDEPSVKEAVEAALEKVKCKRPGEYHCCSPITPKVCIYDFLKSNF